MEEQHDLNSMSYNVDPNLYEDEEGYTNLESRDLDFHEHMALLDSLIND